MLASSLSKWLLISTCRRTSTFEFRCHSPHGAVLALTSSVDLLEVVHQTELRDCIVKHAELLYRHAESIRRIGHDESLYIVTGCLKSDSWGLAAYKAPMELPENLLQLVHIGWDRALQKPNPLYAWTKRGTSEAKCGESSQAERVKDQCLFMRGFKLAFSQNFRLRMRRDIAQDSKPHQPDHGSDSFGPESGNTGGGRDSTGGGRTMGRGGGNSAGQFDGRGSNSSGRTLEATDGVRVETFPEHRSQVREVVHSISRP